MNVRKILNKTNCKILNSKILNVNKSFSKSLFADNIHLYVCLNDKFKLNLYDVTADHINQTKLIL